MLKLDNTLLDELGLGSLTEEQKKAMLQHIYETLELRVGTDLANQMSDQQLEEFEKFIDDGGDANQAQALQWLEANLPNYKDVVNRVFEELKTEVKNMAPQILASSGAAQQAGSSAQPQDPTAQQMQPGMPSQPGMPAPAVSTPQQPVQPGQAIPPAAAPGYAQPNVSVQPQPLPQQQPAYQGAPAQQPYYQQPAAAPMPPQYGYGTPPQSMPPQQPYQSPQQNPQQGQGGSRSIPQQGYPYQQPPAGPGV